MSPDAIAAASAKAGMTVVLCCSDDFDVAHTIESIDRDVELVATITPNLLIEGYFRAHRIPFAVTARGNHATTTNAGLALASRDKVLVMDSDCIFDPGALEAVEQALDVHPVVNLPITFDHSGARLSRAIAACRHFDNTYSNAAYKPGIAFHRDVRDRIGGYWYDERIAWPCDSELLWRLQQHGIPIHHLRDRGIVHRPISFKHVVRAYFHYGRDGWKRVSVLQQSTHLVPTRNLVRKMDALLRSACRERGLALNALLEAMYISGFLFEAMRAQATTHDGAAVEDDGVA